jgi:ubiquinone/menaquinone biosynthesis C-methylase UbiE
MQINESTMNKAVYNTIGKTYDTTRKPDPEIVQTLIRLIQPKAKGHYLDIACGSGNYTNALAQTDMSSLKNNSDSDAGVKFTAIFIVVFGD